jgi:hyperosmotically inducible protein
MTHRNRSRIGTLLLLGALMASVAACAAVSGRETPGQYVDDATISTKVRAKLIGDPALKPFQISVETMQGVVQLSGFVDSWDTKHQAGTDAMNVEGVHDVHNNLVVR